MNDGDAKIKKNSKKIFREGSPDFAFSVSGGAGYIYLYPHNPKSNPQPANIDILHIINQYATHNGQNVINIAAEAAQKPNADAEAQQDANGLKADAEAHQCSRSSAERTKRSNIAISL